jgi:hypothetical protein
VINSVDEGFGPPPVVKEGLGVVKIDEDQK